MHEIADVLAEPKGAEYRALIDFALEHSQAFSLTMRDRERQNESCPRILKSLSPFLESQSETSVWPGTLMAFGHTARVLRYGAVREAGEVLKTVSPGLYRWVLPERPEDLAFYSEGGCWLGSIAHEKDAFVLCDRINLKKLQRAVPTLKIKVRKAEGEAPYGR